MVAKIERVRLNNSSRKGYYFRVTDTVAALGKVHSYYKVAGAKGAKTKEIALQKFKNSIDRRVEEATLHFRVDYDERSGHYFKMEDSRISLTVKKGMSDSELKMLLEESFAAAFEQELGKPLWESANREMVAGLERRSGEGEDRIVFQYRHAPGGKLKSISKDITSVREEQSQLRRFFDKVRGKK